MRVVGAALRGLVFGLGFVLACSGGTPSGTPAAGGMATQSGGAAGSAVDHAGSTIQSGAASGTGGSSAGGSATTPPTTPYEACVAYFNAQCNRVYQECGQRPPLEDPCPYATEWCPDFLFAEGSSFDVESALACAETFATFDCDKLSRGLYPDCVSLPGKRALGEACRFSHQCASSACGSAGDPAHPKCGKCVAFALPGGACDYSASPCPDGYECIDSICQQQLVFNLPDGSPCERYGQCAGIDYCFPTLQGEMRCQAPLAMGAPCVPESLCTGGTCTNGVCAPATPDYAAIGEPCVEKPCGPGGWCLGAGTLTAQCIAQVGRGEVCAVFSSADPAASSNCNAKELVCYCEGDQATCVRHCLEPARANRACTDPQVYCVAGTRCDAGKCVGVETQGLFEDACGL